METITQLILAALGTGLGYIGYILSDYLKRKNLDILSPLAEKAIQAAQNLAITKIKSGLVEFYDGSKRAQLALDWIDENKDILKLTEWQVYFIKKLIPAEYENLKVTGMIRDLPAKK